MRSWPPDIHHRFLGDACSKRHATAGCFPSEQDVRHNVCGVALPHLSSSGKTSLYLIHYQQALAVVTEFPHPREEFLGRDYVASLALNGLGEYGNKGSARAAQLQDPFLQEVDAQH